MKSDALAERCRSLKLILSDVDGAAVKKLADELGQIGVRTDVTRASEIDAMIAEPYTRWGRLDILFNNAGVIRVQPMLEEQEHPNTLVFLPGNPAREELDPLAGEHEEWLMFDPHLVNSAAWLWSPVVTSKKLLVALRGIEGLEVVINGDYKKRVTQLQQLAAAGVDYLHFRRSESFDCC